MAQSHFFKLSATPPQNVTLGGARIDANGSNFPALEGMSLSLLTLLKGGVREPHWHPHAHELGYCIQGKGRITIVGSYGEKSAFTIEPGSAFFVPMGFLHDIENCGEDHLNVLLCFNNISPEELNLSNSCGAISSAVLGALFDEGPAYFGDLHIEKKPAFIVKTSTLSSKPITPDVKTPYKLHLDALTPQIQGPGGWAKKAFKGTLPILENLALYLLHLDQEGIREPHWHPNAHELNYVIRGKVRITLVSPGEQAETFELSPGDASFLPKGYLHDIESIGQEDVLMAVYFNDAVPSDIGLSNSIGAYSPEILGALFKKDPTYFAKLASYAAPRHVLKKYKPKSI